jgi:hypothetical protein
MLLPQALSGADGTVFLARKIQCNVLPLPEFRALYQTSSLHIMKSLPGYSMPKNQRIPPDKYYL